MTDAPKLLTINEVARILRVHRATVSRLINSGAFPCIAVGSRRLVHEMDLQAFIDNQRRSLAANESPKEA